ncbi:hypothetical protein QFC22_005771 [Naganishia vaughanmartiniae]|uniref:Uncharacterized protein n=1 Tax=Naganishia vaughanmartiniae TaxID=1424756 RepID=A0ACC2WT27_9TREE|nr:hypothetical protein QFC22_005771 [Naganishia vaughanmartiniae]
MSRQQLFTGGPAPSAHAQRCETSEHRASQVDSQSSSAGPIYQNQNSSHQPTSQDTEAWMQQEAAASGNQQTWMEQMQYSSYVGSSRALPQQGVTYQPVSQVSSSNVPGQYDVPSDLGTRGHHVVKTEFIPQSAHPTDGSTSAFSQSGFQQPPSDGQFTYPMNDYQNAPSTAQPFLTAESFANLSTADMDALNGYVFNMDPSWAASMAAPQPALSHQISGSVDDTQTYVYPVWNDGQMGGNNLPTSEAAVMTNGYLAQTPNLEPGAQSQLWQIADTNMQHVNLAYQGHAKPVHVQNAQNTAVERQRNEPTTHGNGNSAKHSVANALQVTTGATFQHFNKDMSQAQYWPDEICQTNATNQLDLPQDPTSHQTRTSSNGTYQQGLNANSIPQKSTLTPSSGPTYHPASATAWQTQEKTSQQPQTAQYAPQTLNAAQPGLPDTAAYSHTLQHTQYPAQPVLQGMNAAASSDPQFMAYTVSTHDGAATTVPQAAMPSSAGYLKHSAIRTNFGDLTLGGGEIASSNVVIFLCPPPTACIIGLPWWQTEDAGKLRSPTINISLTGENPVPASMPFWTTVQNKVHEESAKLRLTAQDPPFLGKVSNKGLHISDGIEPKEDKKPRVVKAVMAVHLRDKDGQPGSEIGSFDSREIKIVSKPSKKRSSARTSELFLQHGTLITLFNRIKAQTSTTKFLAISPNLRQLLGSDGQPLPLNPSTATTENGFVADQNSWDPFTIWLVDPYKSQTMPETYPMPDAAFPPPSDVITMQTAGVAPMICFNNTVRLQCRATGLITPVMVIRKVDGPQTVQAFEGTRKENELSKCPVNELPGDPVCQLHKIISLPGDNTTAEALRPTSSTARCSRPMTTRRRITGPALIGEGGHPLEHHWRAYDLAK